jgi:hypothetical protein
VNLDLLDRWLLLLQSAAGATLGPTPSRDPSILDAFRDEQGHRRSVDRPLIASAIAIHPGPAPAEATLQQLTGDVRLWWALHDPIDGADCITSRLLSPGGTPPIVHHRQGTTIEVWTEVELAATHALVNAGGRFGNPAMIERAIAAARWHTEHMQPDNATNHAWGTHAFILAAMGGHADCEMYAQTLLHNCQISFGKPDLLSAYALLDSARELEAIRDRVRH